MSENTCYILEPGASINNLTPDERTRITNSCSIAKSYIPFAGIQTRYNITFEAGGDAIILVNEMIRRKYFDSIIMTDQRDAYDLATSNGFKPMFVNTMRPSMAFDGVHWLHGQRKPDGIIKHFATSFDGFLWRYRSQITSALNIAYILKSTDIRLVGVDLTSQHHFYDYIPGLEWLKERNDKIINEKAKYYIDWDREKNHSIDCPLYNIHGNLATISEILKELRKEFKHEGINLRVCSKESKLYATGILDYIGVLDE